MSWMWSGQPRTPAIRESDGGQGTPRRRERGQTLAIVAIMLVALLAMLALVVDLGVAYGERRAMQNAADAGALAGARALALLVPPGGTQDSAAEDAARAAISTYTGLNQADSFEADIASPYVTVTTHKRNATFFASAIGIPHTDVAAVAAARFLPAEPVQFLPLTIREDVWVPGETYQLFDGTDKDPLQPELGDLGPAMWGWLNLDGASIHGGQVSANELKCWVCPTECSLPSIYVPEGADGVYVNGTPGMDTTVLQAVERCLQGQTVAVPIFRTTCLRGEEDCPDVGNGDTNYYIVGFAYFHIDFVHPTADKYIKGTFDSGPSVLSDVIGNPNLEDFGPRTVKLVR